MAEEQKNSPHYNNSNKEGNNNANAKETDKKKGLIEKLVQGKKEQPKEQNNSEKEKFEQQVNELTTTLKRLQAEFENFQKRNAKQNEEYKCFANAKLIEEILPVLDSLEKGIEHNKELILINEQLMQVLKKNGLKKIQIEKGMQFNHDKMECLMRENNPKCKEDEIINVMLSGYELNGKILRPAKVSVNVLKETKNPEEENEKEQGRKEEAVAQENNSKQEKEQLTKVEETVKKMESD
jgi:molecular chaperone GrpE